MNELSEEQLQRLARRLGRSLEAVVERGFVEQHYAAGEVAELLGVTERTVRNYVEAYETTGGREGLGPTVKLSHKVVRIPASAVNRFLEARRVQTAPPLPRGEEAAA